MSGAVSIAALESALAAAGVVTVVEERGRLAILVAADESAARSIALQRGWIVATAAAHGYTNVALEIAAAALERTPAPRDASLPGN